MLSHQAVFSVVVWKMRQLHLFLWRSFKQTLMQFSRGFLGVLPCIVEIGFPGQYCGRRSSHWRLVWTWRMIHTTSIESKARNIQSKDPGAKVCRNSEWVVYCCLTSRGETVVYLYIRLGWTYKEITCFGHYQSWISTDELKRTEQGITIEGQQSGSKSGTKKERDSPCSLVKAMVVERK